MITISGIDHIVLTVRNIDNTLQFYQSVLGMDKEAFAEGRVALRFGQQKINLHEYGNEFEPKAETPLPGSQDICLLTSTPLEQAMQHIKGCGVEILQGPVERSGATGRLLSFYFRDPDQNLIEIANLICE